MTRKEQNKILDAKIESNVNQYKVDRMNAEISAFSSGDLNKYEFLKRIDLNYKPNALDKARFEFSPLGKTFSTGLDKNAQGYQEEGVIKLLKDIRDGLRGVNRRPNNNRRDDEFDNMSDDVSFDDNDNDNGSFDDDGSFDDNDNGSFDDDDNGNDNDNDNGSYLNTKYNSLLRTHFQLRKNMNDTSKELDKTKDELDKTKDKLYDSHDFNIDGKHKDTKDIYDPNGFDINGLHKDTNDRYNSNGFGRYYTHKVTNDIYDPNGFSIDRFNKYTKTIYDPNGFVINGFHINGFHKDTRSKHDSNGFDINGKHKARSFENQKGKGYVDLPILLSKIYTTTNNNTVEHNSKELVSNVKQLINDLHDNEQITKQVYNNLIKAIIYKQ